jgi:hypothetical protein
VEADGTLPNIPAEDEPSRRTAFRASTTARNAIERMFWRIPSNDGGGLAMDRQSLCNVFEIEHERRSMGLDGGAPMARH